MQFFGIQNPLEDGRHEAEAVSGEQIAFALGQAESQTTLEDIHRKMGILEPTFYREKKVYANMGATEIRRLKQLKDENAKLEPVVANLMLGKAMLQDLLQQIVRPAVRRNIVCHLQTIYVIGKR